MSEFEHSTKWCPKLEIKSGHDLRILIIGSKYTLNL